MKITIRLYDRNDRDDRGDRETLNVNASHRAAAELIAARLIDMIENGGRLDWNTIDIKLQKVGSEIGE